MCPGDDVPNPRKRRLRGAKRQTDWAERARTSDLTFDGRLNSAERGIPYCARDLLLNILHRKRKTLASSRHSFIAGGSFVPSVLLWVASHKPAGLFLIYTPPGGQLIVVLGHIINTCYSSSHGSE